jgi:hypothetical protein
MDGSGAAQRALKLASSTHDAVVLVLNVQPAMSSSRFVVLLIPHLPERVTRSAHRTANTGRAISADGTP